MIGTMNLSYCGFIMGSVLRAITDADNERRFFPQRLGLRFGRRTQPNTSHQRIFTDAYITDERDQKT